MAEPYLKELKSIVERAFISRKELADTSCKHFFSGAAAYVNGRIFMTLTGGGLALKLSEDDLNTLFDQGAKPLQHFPRAPIKKDYALLPMQFFDEDILNHWISRSLEFARK